MDQALVGVLREAVESRRRKESLENALGRVLRKREMDFSKYVEIMSSIRELASELAVDTDHAARVILEKE